MSDTIDYYFSIGSPWAWFGLKRLKALAEAHGLRIEPRAAGILPQNGAIPGRDRPEARRLYGARDLARTAAFLGYPVLLKDRPALSDPTPAAASVIALALDGGDWLTLAAALHEANWAQAADIGQPGVRAAIADAAGFDGAALLAREAAAEVQARLADDITRALREGVFGSPSYVWQGEIYWGQDRLDQLAAHLKAGHAPDAGGARHG